MAVSSHRGLICLGVIACMAIIAGAAVAVYYVTRMDVKSDKRPESTTRIIDHDKATKSTTRIIIDHDKATSSQPAKFISTKTRGSQPAKFISTKTREELSAVITTPKSSEYDGLYNLSSYRTCGEGVSPCCTMSNVSSWISGISSSYYLQCRSVIQTIASGLDTNLLDCSAFSSFFHECNIDKCSFTDNIDEVLCHILAGGLTDPQMADMSYVINAYGKSYDLRTVSFLLEAKEALRNIVNGFTSELTPVGLELFDKISLVNATGRSLFFKFFTGAQRRGDVDQDTLSTAERKAFLLEIVVDTLELVNFMVSVNELGESLVKQLRDTKAGLERMNTLIKLTGYELKRNLQKCL